VPDKLSIDAGKAGHLGLQRSPSAMPTMWAGARQGVGTRHRLKRETAGYPRPEKKRDSLCRAAAHPKWSDSGLKIGGRCYRRLVSEADPCNAVDTLLDERCKRFIHVTLLTAGIQDQEVDAEFARRTLPSVV
jgi:hypothetical protein